MTYLVRIDYSRPDMASVYLTEGPAVEGGPWMLRHGGTRDRALALRMSKEDAEKAADLVTKHYQAHPTSSFGYWSVVEPAFGEG
jgi:hypothetical protein